MTEEEKQALIDSIRAEEAAKLAVIQSKLDGVVNEVKDLRGKKQEIEGERDALKLKLDNVPPKAESTDVETVVKKVLEQASAQSIEEARIAAEARFKNEHKEFDDANDPGGLKYQAFQEKLKMFNLNGLKKETDFLSVFETGLSLMDPKQAPKTRIPYSDTGTGGSGPRETQTSSLSPLEQKVIAQIGWTEKQLLDVKAKHGQRYIDSLLKHSS